MHHVNSTSLKNKQIYEKFYFLSFVTSCWENPHHEVHSKILHIFDPGPSYFAWAYSWQKPKIHCMSQNLLTEDFFEEKWSKDQVP